MPEFADENIDRRLLDAIRGRASMEDIANLRGPEVDTPAAAIEALKQGNERFFSGETQRTVVSVNQRRSQIISQTPFAVILGCSDSRVPPQMIFDRNLGDLFVVRVAGQIVDPATQGSIEYAISHLKCKLIVVMGHEGCGAVKAALASDEQIAKESANIRYLIEQIRPVCERLPAIRDEKARMREAVTQHVRAQVARLRQNSVVQAFEAAGTIAVIGAYYEIGSGAVDFFITPEELAVD
ncbi:MAG TPA: carbonic anhydrase [Herpetosiphon sp.]|uniref:Carbonic anhydrase n=1 Tax=Herpetosiphon aurantiacus (strain ATCC 23779 / DSM 785 / 114-95) TaxID=316274 RepID=A9AW44_HERA2|nr:carbonic anhydrase [Herpetosiphon sp.]ABX03282.1 carbonic anhydrase [Herpetosiphon aurantiacus DSM 785]HBW52578.1 carbonic anhydrase [Herpetosiphon sp.]